MRERADLQFERCALAISNRPWWVIAFCVLSVSMSAPYLSGIAFNTSPEDSLFPHHPERIAYDAFKRQFGNDAFVSISVETDGLFTLEFLEALRVLHEALEEQVPHIEEVTSLVNVRSTRGEGDELIVDELLDDWPQSEADLRALEARIRSTPFYQRTFVGDEASLTAIVLEFETWVGVDFDPLAVDPADASDAAANDTLEPLSAPHEVAIYEAVERVLSQWDGLGASTHVAGLPVTNVRIIQDIGENFVVFLAFSFGSMVVVLVLLFRRAAGVVLPLVVVASALLGTLGYVGWRGAPVNMTVQILPSFLMAVGASASIHVLVLFFQRFDAGQSRGEALRRALEHGGVPISMACVTTAVGLGSFQAADLAPVQDLGVLAPIGIALAWFYAVVLLPALLCVFPMRRKAALGGVTVGGESGVQLSPVGRAVVAAGDFSVRNPRPVLLATTLVIVSGIAGALELQFEFDALAWFPEDDPIHLDTKISDHRMGGSTAVELVIDSGQENGLHAPDLQRRIEGFEGAALALSPHLGIVRKTVSVNGVLKEIHQALNENRTEFYATPGDRALIAQELLLFESSGSDDLEELVDSEFRLARVSLGSIWGSASFYGPFIRDLRALVETWFPDERVSLTGIIPVVMAAQAEIQRAMFKSYALALMTITPLMMLMIGSLRGGLVSMVPNLMPIIVVLGLMGGLGIRIDIFTMLTGSVAIGLAVDDTIHFLHNFYREFERSGDARTSVRRTLETTGQALFTTSVVLSLGFGVFLLASMPTLRIFGAVTALAIVLAFLADIIVAPALVTLATRHRQRVDST